MKRVMLLNGPPRVGKDTIAAALCVGNRDIARLGFADHLKVATHAAYGLPLRFDGYEQCKNERNTAFFGLTPRQAYIAHSEAYMKVLHGPRVFGKLFVRTLRQTRQQVIVVPDSGFRDEALEVVDEIGKDNVMLFRIHRDGCTFEGDSRSYIDLSDVGVACFDIFNNGTVERAVQEIVDLWR